jgi:hypothetical protein
VALTKRDIYFFLERLCEQTNSFIDYRNRKRFGIFKNYKIREGKIRMTSYILQSITSTFEVSRIVEIYSLLGQSLCSYSISFLPCLFAAYNVKSLNVYTEAFENAIRQNLSKTITVLNVVKKDYDEGMSCLVNYTITKK